MNIYYKFVQMFIQGKVCIVLYICINIFLVHTNFDSKQVDSGLKNDSSFNHINRINEYFLYTGVNVYIK